MPVSHRLSGALRRVRRRGAAGPGGAAEPGPRAALLLSTVLFDEEWYSHQAGRQFDRLAAVRHYLDHGRHEDLTPHPLFDPAFVRARLGSRRTAALGDGDPLSFYLSRGLASVPTHPLFDTAGYLARTPEAAEHPHGPTAHYCETGQAAGLVANDWLPAGEDLRGWVRARHDEWRAGRDTAPDELGVDWSDLAARAQDTDVVSVVIPTFQDAWLTTRAVESVVASAAATRRTVECLVWDNGSSAATAVALDALPHRFPQVRLLRSRENLGFALGNNLALPHARGATVVFLNNDTEVPPGWIDPLVDALADPEVLGVQPLLVYPTGAVQSAGVAFPSTGGLPHQLLQGFPVEDAADLAEQRFAALTGAALVARFADLVAVQAFDPVFRNGMEDVDLCQRLAAHRPGHFRVLPEVHVVHHESRTPGRYERYLENRALYLDRWRGVDEPRDDVRLWASCGYRVVDHESRRAKPHHDPRLMVPQPVVVRSARLEVREGPRPLRWALKVAAPAGPQGERWGDTHFARSLADGLRAHGQEVVLDHRGEMERQTARHDDVALLIRGLRPLRPAPENVSIAWVISHPGEVTEAEARSYDGLVAASVTWARDRSREWGIPVEPLLQATDPARFRPDRGRAGAGHPVLFVGNARQEYRRIVRDAVEGGLPLVVYGRGWDRFLGPSQVAADHLDNADLSAAYASAGIVLNDHWDDMRRGGFLSNRIFDAVASGARVVTDDVEGLREVFGESVQPYGSLDDLVQLAGHPDPDAVFGDEEKRLAEAERIRREHSFEARAARLVELAHELRRRRGFSG